MKCIILIYYIKWFYDRTRIKFFWGAEDGGLWYCKVCLYQQKKRPSESTYLNNFTSNLKYMGKVARPLSQMSKALKYFQISCKTTIFNNMLNLFLHPKNLETLYGTL